MPAGLALASLVIFLVVAAFTVPKTFSTSTYVWNKLGFMLTVIAISLPLLVGASFLMGICFGELQTMLIKIPMILLTQAWAEDLLTLVPLPYVSTFGAWAVTIYLCVNAFELEALEAFASTCVMRGAHTAVYWFLFLRALAPPAADAQAQQNWLFNPQVSGQSEPIDKKEPALKRDEDNKQDDKAGDAKKVESPNDKPGAAEPDKRPRPGSQDPTSEDRSLSVTREFGAALVAQDYERAYAMMSKRYRQAVAFEAFSATHREAVKRYGKPLKAVAGLGDEGSLTGPAFDRFQKVPGKDRFAWTYANLAIELDQGDTVRCYDCWLLLVKIKDVVQVGAFEYEECE
jgi:hypothetical protein